MSTLVLLEATAKAGKVGELFALFRRELPATRAHEGCHDVTAHQKTDDENCVVLVEHWDSPEHYQKYLAWREETGVLGAMAALLDGPPNIRFFEASDA